MRDERPTSSRLPKRSGYDNAAKVRRYFEVYIEKVVSLLICLTPILLSKLSDIILEKTCHFFCEYLQK